MTYDPMRDLKDFHDRFDPNGKHRKISAVPGSMLDLLEKRRKLVNEEAKEVIHALEEYKRWIYWYDNDQLSSYQDAEVQKRREELAKELADLLYVVYGTAEELDIPLKEVFEEVHKSNMAKVWPDGQVHYNEYGKIIKPPTYTPPDLSGVINDRLLPTSS